VVEFSGHRKIFKTKKDPTSRVLVELQEDAMAIRLIVSDDERGVDTKNCWKRRLKWVLSTATNPGS